jgi:hypothetical protein
VLEESIKSMKRQQELLKYDDVSMRSSIRQQDKVMQEAKRKESPVPVLVTQMLDDQSIQRREKSKERMKVNQMVSNFLERPQFIRTNGTWNSISDDLPKAQTTIQSVNSNERTSKGSSIQTTTRADVRRTYRSNFNDVQDDETNKSPKHSID